MIKRTQHTSLQGKTIGMFYHFDDGRCLYLSWESGASTKALIASKNAWAIDYDVLYAAERQGCTAIGIAHRINGMVIYYITNLRNYWNPPSESHAGKYATQRILGRDKFLVNTSLSESYIERMSRLK